MSTPTKPSDNVRELLRGYLEPQAKQRFDVPASVDEAVTHCLGSARLAENAIQDFISDVQHVADVYGRIAIEQALGKRRNYVVDMYEGIRRFLENQKEIHPSFDELPADAATSTK